MDLRNQRLRVVLAGVALSSLTACREQPSSSTGANGGPVATQSMYMHTIVEAWDPSSAAVFVVLNGQSASIASQGSFDIRGQYATQGFKLDGGDQLSACVGPECQALNPQYTNFLVNDVDNYHNTFSLAPNTPYVVSFTRPGAVSALNTSVTMPPPFTITTPINGQRVTDGDTIQVSWAPIGAENLVQTSANVDCTTAMNNSAGNARVVRTDTDHNGMESLAVVDLIAAVHAAPPPSVPGPIAHCNILIDVTHVRSGYVDSAFRGGEAIGRYWARVNVEYVPAMH